MLGEQTEEVLRELLGMSPEAVAALRDQGVIGGPPTREKHELGVIANTPHHLAGALDSDGADKGARFMQLCDALRHSCGHARLDRQRAETAAAGPSAHRQEVPVHRSVVSLSTICP
jgi:hypothetical protein